MDISNELHYEEDKVLSNCPALSPTEVFYISILKDFLHKSKSRIDEKIEWNELAHIAYVHGTEGIVYYQLKEGINNSQIPDNIRTRFFKAYADTCYKYEKRKKLLSEIDTGFKAENIQYLIFKGMDIAELYPMPKLRTMGDTDILVHEFDKQNAYEVLLKIGCESDVMGEYEWSCHREKIEIELHHALVYKKPTTLEAQEHLFSQVWSFTRKEDNLVRNHLTWEFHLLYVIAHLRKHFINSGVGFRFFLDIAVIISECNLDWEWIEKELKKMRMWDFALNCFAFCRSWFDIELNVKAVQLDFSFFCESTKHIIKNGSHGTSNPDNKFNSYMYLDKYYDTFGSRLKWRASLLFPSYKALYNHPRYSFVKGRAYLLPVAWIYRFCNYFRRKHQTKDKNVASILFTGKQSRQRLDYLERWGI